VAMADEVDRYTRIQRSDEVRDRPTHGDERIVAGAMLHATDPMIMTVRGKLRSEILPMAIEKGAVQPAYDATITPTVN